MTSLRAFALLAALLCGGLGFVPSAHADTSCSISPANLTFGSVAADGSANATTTWTWNCNSSEFLAFSSQAQIKMCFKIGAGSATGSTINARLMRSPIPNNDPLSFQIYADPSHTKIWTDSITPPSSVEIPITYPLSSIFGLFANGSGSGTVTLHGVIPAQALAAGMNYSSSFSGVSAQIVYHYSYNGAPSTCNSGGTTGTPSSFSFTASADVPGLCTISTATDLDFGSNPGTLASNHDSTSAISMACRLRSAWNVGLNNGINASGSVRRMRLNATSNYVNYELYRDSGRTARWGHTINTDTYSGTSNATTSTLTVYGRVPGSPVQSVPAGTYNDIVTVTVTY